MSLACPHCGGEIVGLTGGTSPFPGWRPEAQSGVNRRNPSAQMETQSSAQSDIAHGFEVQDLEVQDLKHTRKRAYNEAYPAEFLKFWNAYPRKRDKRKALKAWRNAIRRNSPDAILAGAKRYRDDPNRLDEFTKYAEGWLNGDGWEDEPLPARLNPNGRREDPPRAYSPVAAELEIEAALERGHRD